MPVMHIVCLKFKEEYSDERITQHFIDEVNLKNRMPDLVESWSFHRNISLEDRKDVNGGCQWVVMCRLYGDEGDAREKVKAYLAHPEHKEVGVIQNPMLEGRFVVDVVGDKW